MMLISCPRIIFSAVCCSLSNVVFSQLEPILALRMNDFFLTSVQTGAVLAIAPFIYIFGTLLTPCLPQWIDKRVTLMSSTILMGVFCFFIGPSQLLGMPETLNLCLFGLFTSSVFLAPMVIPVLPEMIEASKEAFPHQNIKTTNNYASALFNTGLGLGTCIGPLYGAMMEELTNFRLTEDYLGVFLIAFGVLYFTCAGGLKAFRNTFGK